jgi:hypothetical protein
MSEEKLTLSPIRVIPRSTVMPRVPQKFAQCRLESSNHPFLSFRRRVQSRFRRDLLRVAE